MADLQYANTACPYCEIALDPPPKAKRRCPACRRTIYVRVGPDAMVYLLQDTDRPALERAWVEFRLEQDWRRRALELVDEASFARTEAEMRAKEPGCTNRDVYWAIATRHVRDRMRSGDWNAVKAAYARMALAAWDEAESEAGIDGSTRSASRSRARRLMREARVAELRAFTSPAGVTAVTVVARCCPACDRGADLPRRLADERTYPVLPHSNCQRGLCQCEYLPVSGVSQPPKHRA
jgi:hypothetical protein